MKHRIRVEVEIIRNEYFRHDGCDKRHHTFAAATRCIETNIERERTLREYWRFVIDEGNTLAAAARHFGKSQPQIRNLLFRWGAGVSYDGTGKLPAGLKLDDLRLEAAGARAEGNITIRSRPARGLDPAPILGRPKP